MQEAVLKNITEQIEMLSLPEYIELIEILVHRLREKSISSKEELNWQELYGLGKGLWDGEDAQEYVDQLREERI